MEITRLEQIGVIAIDKPKQTHYNTETLIEKEAKNAV